MGSQKVTQLSLDKIQNIAFFFLQLLCVCVCACLLALLPPSKVTKTEKKKKKVMAYNLSCFKLHTEVGYHNFSSFELIYLCLTL